MSTISELVTSAAELVPRPVAPSRSEAETWLSDFEAYTRNRMQKLRYLPDRLQPLIDQALVEWQDRQNKYLRAIRSTKDDFLQQAEKDITNLAVGDFRTALIGGQNAHLLIVLNIDWVHTFSWILPLSDHRTLEHTAQLAR